MCDEEKMVNGKTGAFYTLEATWMFGLTLIVFYGILLLCISLCRETENDIAAKEPVRTDIVREFRRINMAKNIMDRDKTDKRKKED